MRKIRRQVRLSFYILPVEMGAQAVEDSFLHFVRGFFGKSERKNLLTGNIFRLDKIRIARSQHGSLAAPRPRRDHDIARLLDRRKLLVIQIRRKLAQRLVIKLKRIAFVFYHFLPLTPRLP